MSAHRRKKSAIGDRSRAKIFIVSAPSGCGKTTLCNRLLKDEPILADSVSMTTRRPRPGETRGKDYRFVSRKYFQNIIKQKGFLEYEENFGNFYGTPRKFIEDNLKKGRPVLLSIDVKGAMKVRRAYPKDSVLIFILPPSINALRERLCLRRSDSDKDIEHRLGLAKKEISYKKRYDYSIVNDDLESAYEALHKIVNKEAGLRPVS